MAHFSLLNHICALANIITSRGITSRGKAVSLVIWLYGWSGAVFTKKGGKAPPFIKH